MDEDHTYHDQVIELTKRIFALEQEVKALKEAK